MAIFYLREVAFHVTKKYDKLLVIASQKT